MASVLSEYLQVFSKYKTKYGDKTAVLMQVGGFYEIYGIDNKKERIGNPVELSRILNITLTRKNKKVAENNWQNPLMLGFPCLALKKYISTLLEENFTIIVIDQIKTPLAVNRFVKNIISPSTYIESNKDECLVLIYVNKVKKDIHIGISAINILTGSSIVHECYSEYNDDNLSLDETVSFLKQYRPREVVISGQYMDNLASHLDLDSDSVLCHYNKVNSKAHNVNYQNAILGNFFENKTMMSNIEYLDLERKPYALLSYVLLIEFVYRHNPMLLRKIYPPEIFVPLNHLILATNTVDQLNVANCKGKSGRCSLFSAINKCSTSVGKRLLMKRILAPIFDVAELEKLYQQVEDFGLLFKDDLQEIEQLLIKILDVERLQRRMSVGIMVPSELASLNTSYFLILKLNKLLKQRAYNHAHILDLTMSVKSSTVLINFTDTCNKVFNLDNLTMCDLDDPMQFPIFQRGVFSKIDELHDDIQDEISKINAVASYLSSFITSNGQDSVRVEYIQSTGYYLTTSNTKAKKILHSMPSNNFVFKSNKMTTKVTSHEIDISSKNISLFRECLKKLTRKRYKQVIKYFLSSYSNIFSTVTKFVSEVDVTKSNYKTSCMYNYCRPKIKNKDTKDSFIHAKNLRHPIIEQIDKETEYVSNDLSIGTNYNGMILYSMNSCGKTSLLKACGLSVILAQAGCYVPASSYTYYPFKCIMTRILSEDNIMKGQSSFVAEMSELRAILRRAHNRQTLVLADEITHGTEHTSGSSIFISSVEILAKRKVNFMFTTHLHNVYPFVKDIQNVRVFHLSVSFLQNKTIVFERKLKDGPGDSIYGLEVCEFLNMDKEFLARAFQIRNMVTSDKTDSTACNVKLSRYNKNKTVQHCEICNYSPKVPTDIPLDVHHIRQKHIADCNGMIDGIYKHAKSNLVTLCKQCHVKTHKGEITVFGYVDTSNGKVLQYHAT